MRVAGLLNMKSIYHTLSFSYGADIFVTVFKGTLTCAVLVVNVRSILSMPFKIEARCTTCSEPEP